MVSAKIVNGTEAIEDFLPFSNDYLTLPAFKARVSGGSRVPESGKKAEGMQECICPSAEL